MKAILPIILIVVGGAALSLSVVWSSISGRSGWSSEDAAKLRELDDRVVELHYKIEAPRARTGGTAPQELPPVYQKAIEERNQLRAKRDGALERPGKVAGMLRYGGIGVLLVGVIAWFASKNR